MAATRIAPGTYACASVMDTIELGRMLGTLLRDGDVVVLTGDLGAGKTQLTKGIAAGMGIADDITSPTFTIGMTYAGPALDLYHFDLYRLDDAAQLEDTGILDVAGVDGACVVEWGEDYADELGDDRLDVSITRGGDGMAVVAATGTGVGATEPVRRVALVGTGPRGRALVSGMDAHARPRG